MSVTVDPVALVLAGAAKLRVYGAEGALGGRDMAGTAAGAGGRAAGVVPPVDVSLPPAL